MAQPDRRAGPIGAVLLKTVPLIPRRAIFAKTRVGPIGGPPREVAQLGQDSAVLLKRSSVLMGAALTKKTVLWLGQDSRRHQTLEPNIQPRVH